jgi:hypothetical protein
MTSLGWLHLSDLHEGLSNQSNLWPNIREQIVKNLRDLRRKCGPWHVVFFSGDLTQKGGKDEFDDCTRKLEDLWEEFRKLGSDPVLMAVPGNHDLVRPGAETRNGNQPLIWATDQESRDRFWRESSCGERRVVENAFSNYLRWWKGHPFPRAKAYRHGLLPGDFSATVEAKGVRLGVLGLNTAFLQLDEGDFQEKLTLDAKQFHECCRAAIDGPRWVASHDICLLLTHHPPDWLDSDGRKALETEIAPPGRFGAHLFGHMHEGNSGVSAVGGALPRIQLQANSLFGLEKYDGEAERRHGFTAGRIEFKRRRTQLRVWPRRAERSDKGGWRLEADRRAFELKKDDGTRPYELEQERPINPRRRRVWGAVALFIIFVVAICVAGVREYQRRQAVKRVVATEPAVMTSNRPVESALGITLYRLRPSAPSDDPEIRLARGDSGALPTEWTPVRVAAGKTFAEGERLLLVIESGRLGNLYVVDQEQYADGSLGVPYLIFPTTRILGGRNRVEPGQVVEVPGWTDQPPYFRLRRSRGDHIGEVLTVIVAAAPIGGIVVGPESTRLSRDWLAPFERASASIRRVDMDAGEGQAYSRSEHQASGDHPRLLTHESPPPQTIYRMETTQGNTLVVRVPLTIGSAESSPAQH